MQTKQRTSDWHNQRKFRFTGSKIHNLLGSKGISKSYVFEVVFNSLFPDLEESFESYDMARGTSLEEPAFNKLTEILGKQFITTKKCGFFPYEDIGGASPDGLTSDNGVIEIKCPKAKTFFEVVRTNEVDPQYYDQMQMEMLSTGAEKAYYFNYFVDTLGREYWHLINIKRDNQRIELIKNRLEQARDLAKIYKIELLNNKQF